MARTVRREVPPAALAMRAVAEQREATVSPSFEIHPSLAESKAGEAAYPALSVPKLGYFLAVLALALRTMRKNSVQGTYRMVNIYRAFVVSTRCL